MNLNNATIEEFRELLRNCDDESYNHILWVSNYGDIFIDKFSCKNPSSEFIEKNKNVLFWKGVFYSGNGYVGENAASDTHYLEGLFQELVNNWNIKYFGHVEN